MIYCVCSYCERLFRWQRAEWYQKMEQTKKKEEKFKEKGNIVQIGLGKNVL